MIDFIASTSLIWLIYTFLFIESDRKIAELFDRLKFSRSLNDKGVIIIKQLWANQAIGIPEILELGEKGKGKNATFKNIERFRKKITHISNWKNYLTINLFVLTLNALLLEFVIDNLCWVSISKLHIVSSLILVAFYYKAIVDMEKVRFVNITVENSS